MEAAGQGERSLSRAEMPGSTAGKDACRYKAGVSDRWGAGGTRGVPLRKAELESGLPPPFVRALAGLIEPPCSAMRRLLFLFFGSLGLILLAGIVVALRQPKPMASVPLSLPDGSVVRILAVTYGTNHIVGRPLARLVARMPAPVQAGLLALLGKRAALQFSTTTSEPKLIIWLGRATNNATTPPGSGYFNALLSDASGFISGDHASIYGWWSNPEQMQFGVIPRRDPVIAVNFFYHSPTGGVSQCGSLPFANPLYGAFPQWQPEVLPATRRVEDVAVTLEKVSTGHDQNSSVRADSNGRVSHEFGTNRVDGQNSTVCFIRLQPLINSNQVWCVAGEEVSDATGNKAPSTSFGWGSPEESYFSFEPGLWPSESAWKVRCEIKRARGFDPGETFVFPDIPFGSLGVTNRINCTTNFGGVTVTLDQVVRRGPNTNNSWSTEDLSQAHFTTAGLTNGLHLDLISARSDTGTNLDCGSWSSSQSWRTYCYRNLPLEAKTVDFTFAVQRGRWVEFTVKPEVGTARREYERARDGAN